MTAVRVGLVFCLLAVLPASAQDRSRSRITQAISGGRMITLGGNTHPMARAEFDRGDAPADLPMQQMQLVLTRSAAQQTDLDALLAAQQDSSSPQYHQWLTPEQFGQRFGASDEDVQKITGWLEGNGFHIDRVANGRNLIEFTGAASQVENTFHTQIHRYMVNGQSHWANASNPQIPAALAGVVAGIATLHDFRKKPQAVRAAAQFEGTISADSSTPQFTSGGTHALAPADYATIYDINPLYANGINGSGVTIAVVGRSDINVSDVVRFRSIFGLSNNPPQVIYNGTNPGVLGNGEVDEATLDVTWAGAVAPNAIVKLVVSASTHVSDGVDLSEEYVIDNNLADIMTESFGSCEASYTQAQASLISSLAAQAAAQGITYVVASGDSGAAGCDDPSTVPATHGVSVNILSSTPYNIAVGGTQFNEGSGFYWNSGNSTANLGSAISYIPEVVWNESCTLGTCATGNSPGLWAGGGGASTLVAKPSWQTGVTGIPADNHRYVPDVSLTAAGHDPYLVCLSSSCTPTSTGRFSLEGYAGTSAATPSFAAIMALVVQKTGSRQGQANVILYQLAAQEQYSQCASTLGVARASNCIFNDITVGNNAVPGENGGLYAATAGYDPATGLGSIDVANLVNRWSSAIGTNPRIRFSVDSPLSAPVAGIAKVSGWALSDTAAVASVGIAVDGVSYGNATYGAPRADVCAVYVGRAGCPNVGWSLLLNTTLLVDGSHVLDVTITAVTGQKYTGTSNFTVANAAAANPMRIAIDIPNASLSTFAVTANFSGWALDDLAGISRVTTAIDGVPFSNVTYGAARPDVCAAYPGRIGCPGVGWTLNFDPTPLVDGTHTLAVTATTTDGRSSTATAPFQSNYVYGGPPTVVVDRPNAQSGPLSGPVTLYGWAITPLRTVDRIAVAIDGTSFGDAHYGDPRGDVCAVFSRVGCPNVGWDLPIDTTRFADGAHSLQLTAYSSGLAYTTTTSFTVANGGNAARPTKIYIDQPTPQATLLGTTMISGWALNNTAAITNVAIFVDGIQKGLATYGANRADVCGLYTGPNCPNAGWTFPLDTGLLANGTHVIEATASAIQSGQVQYGAASVVFTAANWTTNPTRITIDNPSTKGGPASGVVNANGWAMDDYEAISSVGISIDGVSYGTASYGAGRGDVCTAFPGRPGCPNVGWNFVLDTTLLNDGAHVMGVTTTTARGRHSTVTSPFSVSNSAGNPIQVTIDAPASNATVAGGVHTYGWALEGAIGVASVQILVDGAPFGTATYGDTRGDVCAIYSGLGCPNIGWDFSLDTTGLANGTHTFAVRAAGADGAKRTVGNSFQVLNN